MTINIFICFDSVILPIGKLDLGHNILFQNLFYMLKYIIIL